MRAAALVVAVVAAAFTVAPSAEARTGSPSGITVRYPSGQVPDAGALAAAISDPSVSTVVFEKGTNTFSASIQVFRRTGITFCGATGNPADVEIDSSADFAFFVEESREVTFRDLTIRSNAAFGEAIRLQAVRSSTVEGFARDVTVRGCRLEGFAPIRTTVRARGLDVADCRIDVTRPGGAGIVWYDGPELLVTRTQFTNSASGFASAAVAVLGPFLADSEGDRARKVILTRNRVSGDFATGFDLADVVDCRVQRNRIEFPSPTYVTASGAEGGRAGISVRRQSASALTEDYEVRGNRVRGAHTGLVFQSTGRGIAASNDLRGCGDATADARFGDTGSAIRIELFGPVCQVRVERNDLRNLRSDPSAPAVVVVPSGQGATCFPDGARNRVDAGRNLY